MAVKISPIRTMGYWRLQQILLPVHATGVPPITHYWTDILILDHSYLVGNLTSSKIAETKALEPLKF
jgi:hypothetical protein